MTPFFRAIEQLDDRDILGVLVRSLLLSAAVFALLCAGCIYGLHHVLTGSGWIAWAAGIIGGLAALVAAICLFLPVAVVIASLFTERVCRAVERRWYPALPEPAGASFSAQLWDGLVLGGLVLLLSMISLLLALLIPGIGAVLGWGITAWALGRGLFVSVAMRRMSRAEATALYASNRGSVLLQGAALALAGFLPLVNLLLPVIGPACMVHVLMPALGRR